MNIRTTLALFAASPLLLFSSPASALSVTACKFERLPLMLIIARGGMGASDNTLQVGETPPVPLSMGSSLMLATVGVQELTFSLRMPSSVSVSAPGNDTQTFYGECIGSPVD